MKNMETTIRLENGLEARPVAMLVQVASQYESKIYIEANGKKINAKSIMGMMSLGLDIGEKVNVYCEGSDEEEAVNGVVSFLNGK